MKLGRINTCIQSLAFASVLAVSAVPAYAFDPMGFIVNKIMEEILYGDDEDEQNQQAITTPLRAIPNETNTGYMSPPNGRYVKISGKDYELSFSSRIRDENNRIVQPSWIQQTKHVRYALNSQQQVEKVWFLTPGEE